MPPGPVRKNIFLDQLARSQIEFQNRRRAVFVRVVIRHLWLRRGAGPENASSGVNSHPHHAPQTVALGCEISGLALPVDANNLPLVNTAQVESVGHRIESNALGDQSLFMNGKRRHALAYRKSVGIDSLYDSLELSAAFN